MSKVVTFGEIMLRLAPPGYLRFVQAESLGVTYGGAEANVAVSLENFGVDTVFVSKVPSHEIGQCAVNSLRRYGVNTSKIARGGDRLGIYFLEKGASQRPSKVIYDRAESAFACSDSSDYNWVEIFSGAHWFHFTGITPAVGGELPKICLEACKQAKKLGLTVSCDINYRQNLWSQESAKEVMLDLMEYVDVCITNEGQAIDVFGVYPETDVETGKISQQGYQKMVQTLKQQFGFQQVVITIRESISASDNNWSAMLYDGMDCYFSKSYSMRIVDRVGGGDGFGAGLIYSQIQKMPPQQAIEFAAAAGCLKHSIEGDVNLVSAEEVVGLAEGDGSGRVQR